MCNISKPLIYSNWSYSPETLNSGKNWQCLSRVTLQIDGWPWDTIGHFYTMLSFVHHFKSIGDVKIELQSGNAQFGSKLTIVFSRLTFKFDGWPWKIGHLFFTTLSFVHHFKAIGIFKLQLQSRNQQFRPCSKYFGLTRYKYNEYLGELYLSRLVNLLERGENRTT